MMDISAPLTDEVVAKLKAGDAVSIKGVIYVARDAAHKRIVEGMQNGDAPPFPLEGAIVYYMGPSPAKPGKVIGAAGPTTSGRMDAYAPTLLAKGLKGMIGKGTRSKAVKEAIQEYKGVYFAAIGGAGALIAQRIKAAEVVAYPELGAEAVYKLEVEDFPVIVVNDIYGGDVYEQGKAAYKRPAPVGV